MMTVFLNTHLVCDSGAKVYIARQHDPTSDVLTMVFSRLETKRPENTSF